MKQDAFIAALRQELGDLPRQEIEDIVSDYREYIGDALAAGRREEEVIAALGDPVKLARELKVQAKYRQWQDRRSVGNLFRMIASIAGLGLLNLLLMVPFIVYLLVLTFGYLAFTGLIIAGIVGVFSLSAHRLFGTSLFGMHVGDRETASTVTGTGRDRESNGDVPVNMTDLKSVGNRFVFDLRQGSEVSMVTRAGPIELRKSAGVLDIETPSHAARQMLTQEKDGTLSIAQSDVVKLDVTNEDDHVSFSHAGQPGASATWDISSGDDDHVKIQQAGNGEPGSLTATSGSDSVRMSNGALEIDSDGDHVRIYGPHGASSSLIAMLPVGVVGLLLWLWLTRVSWRVVTRYIKRQVDIVAASLEREQRN